MTKRALYMVQSAELPVNFSLPCRVALKAAMSGEPPQGMFMHGPLVSPAEPLIDVAPNYNRA